MRLSILYIFFVYLHVFSDTVSEKNVSAGRILYVVVPSTLCHFRFYERCPLTVYRVSVPGINDRHCQRTVVSVSSCEE